MPYATQANLETAASEAVLVLVADHDDDGTPDVDVIAAALAKASSFMDSYLSAYLPITTVPDVLIECNCAIALYYLRVDKDLATEDSKLAFKQWWDWLKDIAKGVATLDVGGGVEEDDIDAGDPEMVAEARVFTRATAGRIL